jgi:hypothetical protein
MEAKCHGTREHEVRGDCQEGREGEGISRSEEVCYIYTYGDSMMKSEERHRM